MLFVICGEDTAASRNHYLSVLEEYKKKNYEVTSLQVSQIEEVNRWLGESVGLFSEKRIFSSQGINKKIRRDSKVLLEELKKISESKEIELIDWEEVSQRDLKFAKLAKVKEWKPSESIFSFLDSVYPGNKSDALEKLKILSETEDMVFIFTMVCRHIRTLLLISTDNPPKTLQSWQLYKLKKQSSAWDSDRLIQLYEGLGKIDISQKTSGPFSLHNSLDILLVHFL